MVWKPSQNWDHKKRLRILWNFLLWQCWACFAWHTLSIYTSRFMVYSQKKEYSSTAQHSTLWHIKIDHNHHGTITQFQGNTLCHSTTQRSVAQRHATQHSTAAMARHCAKHQCIAQHSQHHFQGNSQWPLQISWWWCAQCEAGAVRHMYASLLIVRKLCSGGRTTCF